MVKSNKSKKRKNRKNKGFKANNARARKINASTPYETCSEQLSPFGGLLPLIKFLDLIDFKQIFNFGYIIERKNNRLAIMINSKEYFQGKRFDRGDYVTE